MYLKSIEVQGFKSFANKIVFEFHNGITGIVGPNGSGKSNVADAVRWVLGEQRIKQLRGASMQDVIFSGTESRKPQGFAYVAITLDNADHQLTIDYDQVTVSRRVYRSGESEYMINGSACRLKDVNELFYDTGIGKEGYSIIGQGQIDKILSGKPEDRRELFDEAAGIVKFKRRKGMAQKKLEDERQNLVRISDILSELEKQVGPLKKQSEAAREYLKLKEDLKRYEANLFLLETENLRDQIQEFKGKTAVVSGDLEEAREKSESGREAYEQVELLLAKLDQSITDGRSRLSETNVEKSGLEGKINVLMEQINTEKMNEEHILGRIASIGQETGEKREEMERHKSEQDEIQKSLQLSSTGRREAKTALDGKDEEILRLDRLIEEKKAGMIDGLNEKASLTARQQRYEAMLEQVQVRRSEVCRRILQYKSEESEQEGLLESERENLAEAEAKIASLRQGEEKAKTESELLDQEVRRLRKSLNERQQEYRTWYTKLESLKNIAERYEGYGNSIRKVMEVRDRIGGIHGVVADLISAPPKYEIAIETALGGSIQNVVTDSDQTAKYLIEYLKKNKYGRATFLPLDSLDRGKSPRQDGALREPGVLGLASSLVETEPRFSDLSSYLLGRVLVVDTIDHAIDLARKYRHSLRIVTLEGELLNAGGSMTGGAFRNTSNLLGRKREIEELESLCEKSLIAVNKMEEELAQRESLLSECRRTLEKLRGEKQNAFLEQNTIRMNLGQAEKKKAEIQESYSDLSLENTQLEEQLKEIEENRRRLSGDVTALETVGREADQDIKSMTERLSEERRAREEMALSLEGLRMEDANLRQKHEFVQNHIDRLTRELSVLEAERTEQEERIESSRAAMREKNGAIVRNKELIGEISEEIAKLEQAVKNLTEKKDQTALRQKQLYREREELNTRISLLDKELFRIQSQMEKMEEQLENQVNYMWEEYQLTRLQAESLREEAFGSRREMKALIGEVRESIRGLGSVNVNAIEDYKEVSERYEFLCVQHGDLIRAEEALIKIVEELDSGMRRQFEEKFGEIREEFNRVFKELFGGGRGTLVLVDGEDILEAGIQIISQPPGKKLQNMMQLSGGEKALTAIALLFAIQNLKPSPFCLLDEIEAALDDSNVDRFARYLHKLTKYTQFIVITHRRGTMVAADRLYGITMQEKGVSALVSVNLIEADLEQ